MYYAHVKGLDSVLNFLGITLEKVISFSAVVTGFKVLPEHNNNNNNNNKTIEKPKLAVHLFLLVQSWNN